MSKLTVIEYYAAHRKELEVLADEQTLLMLALLAEFGELAIDDMTQHLGWAEEMVALHIRRLLECGMIAQTNAALFFATPSGYELVGFLYRSRKRPLPESSKTARRGRSGTDRVYIFDTTLGDGEQSPGCSMTVAEKLLMSRKLVELGVDFLEVGFPIASQGDFDAVDAVSREFPWAQVAALARCCTLDVERAARSLQHAKRPRIHAFIATSDLHLRYKLKKTQQQVLDEAVAAVELARRHVDDVQFSAEDGARTEPDFLEKISKAVVAAGARTVNIPDTVGCSTPKDYGVLIGRIVEALGDCAIVSVHCHDDLGLAVANSLAGVEAGARQIECTINGIGARAGNCSLEEFVMILKTRSDAYPFHTGIHTEHLYSASELLSSIITFGPQPNKAIVGRNAFAHEAGIHQDGYIKEKSTYEFIDPQSVGVLEGKLVLGKHSGRHALNQRAKELGYDLSKAELDDLYHRFSAVANQRKKGLVGEEIEALIRAGQRTGIRAAD